MRRRKQREDLVPELTPLIDVIFLLLIFFMVTTVFKKDEAVLLLQLPKANDAMAFNKKPKKGLVIELSLLELALNGQKSNFLKFDKFCEKLKDRDVLIDLRVDKKVPYEKVIKVLNVLQKYKLSNLSLITDY
jgi:biopolymer transport protein ExbD